MLVAYPKPLETGADLHAGAVWIDLIEPTEQEARLVAQMTGLHVPSLAELSEIESSSRLQRRGEALYLSMPTITPPASRGAEANADKGDDAASGGHVAPVGFVLARDRLITVRFARLPSFETFTLAIDEAAPAAMGSVAVFLGLLEGVVDRMADLLERQGDVLDVESRRIFHPPPGAARKPARMAQELRVVLREVGAAGDLISNIRDTLLGIGRIVPYVAAQAAEWIDPPARGRFETLRADIASLNDYDAHLSNKVQFLLDATLGFIGIEQNNIIKVLTVVSIVGIPPTFVASLYGMNFKDIPELGWSFGYPYALGLMVVTAILPLVWFRLRGWL